MYVSDWVRENFGDEARWLGAGTYGEAWEIIFNGKPATLKITGSRAEEFCVESIKSMQPPVDSDPEFAFPYILDSGDILQPLNYDMDWYEAHEAWSPMHLGTYFYIREYAIFPEQDKERVQKMRSDMYFIAKEIYADYGLLILDIGVGNWGFVDREGIPFLVPIDLACGNEENWWSQVGDINDQIDQIPFEPPDWLE